MTLGMNKKGRFHEVVDVRECLIVNKIFMERGYEVKKMTGMDMFPRTPHCETVVLLEKK